MADLGVAKQRDPRLSVTGLERANDNPHRFEPGTHLRSIVIQRDLNAAECGRGPRPSSTSPSKETPQ